MKTVLPVLLAAVCVFSACKDDPEPKSSDKQMSEVKIAAGAQTFDAAWDADATAFLFMVPLGFDQTALASATVTFTVSEGATANPSSGRQLDLTAAAGQKITVTAADGSTAEYIIKKQDGTSDKAEITSFSLFVNGEDVAGEIDAATRTITVTVSASAAEFLTECTPTFAVSLGATADPATGVAQDFSKDVVYTVTAHDGTTKQTWTVKTVMAALTGNEVVHFYLYVWEGTANEGEAAVQMGDNNGLVKIDAENRIITWNMPVMPTWFTPEKLNVYPAVIEISNKATVEPDWDVPQDFSKEVVYTVTAENGDKKTWTVKPPKFYVMEKWSKDFKTEYNGGVPDANLNSVAIIGDYVALGRTQKLINKADGTLASEQLNITGISDKQSQPVPFFITNDEAGNMVGGTLNAWNAAAFTIFKWTSATAAPEVLMEYPTSAGIGFGRKWQAFGDVNGKGAIIASNIGPAADVASGEHYMWKIDGGVADVSAPTILQTNTPMGAYGYQHLTPTGADFTGPYYVGSAAVKIGEVQYNNDLFYGPLTDLQAIPGPFGAAQFESSYAQGYGNYTWLGMKVFTFGGANMVATLSGTWGYHYGFALQMRNADNSHTPIAIVASKYDNAVTADNNGNGTGGITIEQVDGEVIFYVFTTNKYLNCYRLSSL